MSVLVLAASGLFGLLIGSFLNVVAHRVPNGLSVVSPPSACPGCSTRISARDNVPVLSWLLLRGSCRHCSMRISPRYPAVELGTAVALGDLDRDGYADLVVGSPGETIGRRNEAGRVTVVHGGKKGFDKVIWKITEVKSGPKASVTMVMTSPAGDQGYPGKLDVTVTYTLDDQGSLVIDMAAKSDAATVVNLTNHALFDLAGEGSAGGIYGQRLTIPARRYTPVDAALIPTGELRPVANSVFDFTRGRLLGDGIRDGRDPQIAIGRGWDHNFVLDKGATAEPGLAARVEDPASGRVLEVLTTEPGVQFYSGNFLDGTLTGKGGHVYRMGDGLALEPQKFPDTPNHPAFGSARVDPAHPYHHRMIYRVSVAR